MRPSASSPYQHGVVTGEPPSRTVPTTAIRGFARNSTSSSGSGARGMASPTIRRLAAQPGATALEQRALEPGLELCHELVQLALAAIEPRAEILYRLLAPVELFALDLELDASLEPPLLEVALAGVELARALVEGGLGLGERAVALGDPLRPERGVGIEQVALELGELALAVGQPSLLDPQAVALLREELLAPRNLGLALDQLAEPLLELLRLGSQLAGAGAELHEDAVEGAVELFLDGPELLDPPSPLLEVGLEADELGRLLLQLRRAVGEENAAFVE